VPSTTVVEFGLRSPYGLGYAPDWKLGTGGEYHDGALMRLFPERLLARLIEKHAISQELAADAAERAVVRRFHIWVVDRSLVHPSPFRSHWAEARSDRLKGPSHRASRRDSSPGALFAKRLSQK
jgi:hypothetical protein